MNSDQALALFAGLFKVTMFVVGPLLLASLVAGVLVGIVQTATQINEASVSYVVKVAAVLAMSLIAGPLLAEHAIAYARTSFTAIGEVVK